MLLSLLTFAVLATLTNAAHLIHIRCETTNYYSNYYSTEYSTTNSSAESNLNLLFNSLILNTPKTGFLVTTVGAPPHQIHGLGQCNGYDSNEYCTGCLATASQQLLQGCRHDNGGVAFFDQCAVRYSFDNLFFQLGSKCQFHAQCQQVGASNPNLFKKQLISMFNSISQIAAFNDSVGMLATGVNTQGYKTPKVYGMVQCTRDLSKDQCYKCLKQSYDNLSRASCIGSLECVGDALSCVLMISRSKFFDSDLTWIPPPDPDSMEL